MGFPNIIGHHDASGCGLVAAQLAAAHSYGGVAHSGWAVSNLPTNAAWWMSKRTEGMDLLMQRWWQTCMPMAMSVPAEQRTTRLPAA